MCGLGQASDAVGVDREGVLDRKEEEMERRGRGKKKKGERKRNGESALWTCELEKGKESE